MSKLDDLIASLSPVEQEKLLAQVAEYRAALDREGAQEKFMAYVKMMWPGFVGGRHHALVAKKFEAIANGTLKRLIINMPPRHTKSEFGSYLLPSWLLGRFPKKKVIQCSNTGELAVGFGRKVRNLVGSDQYGTVFPGINLRQDSKAAGRWATSEGGEYFAIGVGGTVTGKGADLLIIDDPHSEQEAALAAGNPEIYDKVYEWYTSGPRQRLQPGGAIVIIMTRWAQSDLTGRVIEDSIKRDRGDEWEIIELPAIMPVGNLYGRSFGAWRNWRLLRKSCRPPSGMPSISRARPVKRVRWLRGIGGRGGRRMIRHGVSLLFRAGIRLLQKTNVVTTVLARLGGFFIRMRIRTTLILFCWTHLKSAWSFRN